jgi:RNA polymerase sigma factor (TIGR02999 family)
VSLTVIDLTRILSAIEQGDAHAAEALLPLVDDELRKSAAAKLAQEKRGERLKPTAVVHEAYMRQVGAGTASGWGGRGHFFAAMATAMRRFVVERVRRKRRRVHRREHLRRELRADIVAPAGPHLDQVALDRALANLAGRDPTRANRVELRDFAGLTVEETAIRGMSERTVNLLGFTYGRGCVGSMECATPVEKTAHRRSDDEFGSSLSPGVRP